MSTNQAHCKKILTLLKRGKAITAAQAWQFGCSRLAARIFDLKEAGHAITAEWVKPKCGNRFKRYQLETC